MENKAIQPEVAGATKQPLTAKNAVKSVLSIIDKIDILIGKIGWVQVVLVMYVVCQEVVLRYFFNKPTMWGYDMQVMFCGSLLIQWGYLELRDRHVRVDAFYQKFSLSGKALANVIGGTLMGFPALSFMLYSSFKYMVRAFQINERMAYLSFWYPPASPFRTVVFVAILMGFLQLIVMYIRDWYTLIKGEKL